MESTEVFHLTGLGMDFPFPQSDPVGRFSLQISSQIREEHPESTLCDEGHVVPPHA